MKKLLTLILLGFIFTTTFGQTFTVPENYKMEKAEDYKKYEPQIKEAIDWLLKTPIGTDDDKRKDINAFLMVWLTGTPNVSVGVDDIAMDIVGENPEMLMIYMAGWAKYSLDNNYSKDEILCRKAAVEKSVEFFKANEKKLKKNKIIKSYEQAIRKGLLEEGLKKKLNK